MVDRPSHRPVDFHLVVPCYTESLRLPPFLDDLLSALGGERYRGHILIVDDGSSGSDRQQLAALVSSRANRDNPTLSVMHLDRNRGKGYAVREGWRAGAVARWLAFADADGATPAYEIARVFNKAYHDSDPLRCYLGSRVRMLGRTVERDWTRHLLGRAYAYLVGTLIEGAVYDSQCGFKLVSQEAFAAIGDLLREDRFAFDAELIAALADAGYRLEEVAVDWRDVPGSKVSLMKDSTRMVLSLIAIHRRRRRGGYRREDSP